LFVSTKFLATFPAKNGISADSPVAGQVGLMGVNFNIDI
jgi:hypothetical protein